MKTQLYFILILIFVLLVMLFALQNAYTITLKLVFWDVKSPLSLVIIVSMMLGAIISILVEMPSKSKKNQRLKTSEEELDILKERIKGLETQEVKMRKNLLKKDKKTGSNNIDNVTKNTSTEEEN